MDDQQGTFPSLTPAKVEALKKRLQRRDTRIGVIGAIVINVLFFGLSLLGSIVPDAFKDLFIMFSWLPWIIIPVIIIEVLILNRPYIAKGILMAYGLAFAVVLAGGVCSMISCFG